MEWLLDQRFDLQVASSGRALHWLRRKFPFLPVVNLPPYRIRYPFSSMELNMLVSGTDLWPAIRREQAQIRAWSHRHSPALLLSDCRFGARVPEVPSVYLTHQLNMAPGKIPLAHRIGSAWQHHLIRQFSECWVPDFPGEPNLSGHLGHPVPEGLSPVFYIGPLSCLPSAEPNSAFRIVALLSGPEPQRTYLERNLHGQLRELNIPALIIRGQPERRLDRRKEGSLVTVNWMSSPQIAGHLCGAEMIIARPGYSTLMDLERFSAPCLLVPTPGQTEQEYLARHSTDRYGVRVQRQNDLQVAQAFRELRGVVRGSIRLSTEEADPVWQRRIRRLLSC